MFYHILNLLHVVLSLQDTRYQLASCIYIYIKYCLIYTVCVQPKFGATAESGIYSYNQTKRIGLWPSYNPHFMAMSFMAKN